MHNYKLNIEPFERETGQLDLGYLMDTKLSFSKLFEYICARAYSMLGFVLRTCSEINDPMVFKALYIAHDLFILEYGSVVWYPNQLIHVNYIESIQNRIIRIVFCKFGWRIGSFLRHISLNLACCT